MALAIVLVIVIIGVAISDSKSPKVKNIREWVSKKASKYLNKSGMCGAADGDRSNFLPRDGPTGDLVENPIDALTIGGYERDMGLASESPKQRHSVYDTTSRFYSTADVDPLIVGQGYEFRDYTRDVYSGRTGVGGEWGLQEFVVDNQPGQVGVDVGPSALSEYEGSILGYNDGIPEQWAFPSTPMQWYRPRRADNYGHDGPSIVDGEKLYPQYVPDHEPYIGEDTEPDFGDVD